MNEFKTQKGTVLTLIDIHGKSYLQVQQRVRWFREEKPEWGIETEVQRNDTSTLARAVIRDQSGRIIATATKFEDAKGFADHTEKAETSAVGRALALCGFGTQFTEDFDEGERLADAPVEKKSTVNVMNPGSLPIKNLYSTSSTPTVLNAAKEAIQLKPLCTACGGLMLYGKQWDSWYCSNYKDKSCDHSKFKSHELDHFLMNQQMANDPGNGDVP